MPISEIRTSIPCDCSRDAIEALLVVGMFVELEEEVAVFPRVVWVHAETSAASKMTAAARRFSLLRSMCNVILAPSLAVDESSLGFQTPYVRLPCLVSQANPKAVY